MEKKNRFIFLFLLLASFGVHSQEEKWSKMMENPDVNFKDVQKEFNNYFQFKDDKKGTGYKQFMRWQYHMYERTYPTGERIDPGIAWREASKFQKRYRQRSKGQKKSVISNWKELGPRTATDITGHWAPGLGRVNSLAFHPTNRNIIYAGTPAGGLWKTTSGGKNGDWEPLTDDLPVLGVSWVALDNSNPNVLYIATGDIDGGYTYSIGVLKSTDAGKTWNTTGLTSDVINKKQIGKIIIHPNNSSILYASSSDGFYRSSNAGANWEKLNNLYLRDFELKPNDPNTIYGYDNRGGRIHRSTNGGQTFSVINSVPKARRSVLAVTPANPNYVYVISTTANTNAMGGVYRSTNSGASFVKINNSSTPDMFGYLPNDGKSQAWYDLAVTVSDKDPNEVHFGGIVTWRSLDGGRNWEMTSKWQLGNDINYIHPDIHDMQYIDGKLYIANDGLIVTSTDKGKTFENISEGLGNRQFYRLGLSKSDSEVYGGGTQDNGSSIFSKGRWHEWLGADGGNVLFNWKDKNIVYGITQQGLSWHKSINGGEKNGDVKITNPGGGAWVVPYEMDHNDPDVIIAGLAEVVKTTDGMKTWSTISNLGIGALRAIGLAPSNSNYIYASNDNKIHMTKDGGANWINISNGLPNMVITYIAVHPSNPEKVAVSFSGYSSGNKVYTTENGGKTWKNVSGSLPNIPANCVLYHDIPENGLYVGMDVGAYYIDDTETDWEPFMTNMPNVIVKELEIHEASNTITAATFGRGLWRSNVAVNKKLIADFNSDDLKVKMNEGSQIVDASQSLNGEQITSWKWSFPEGIPSSYNGQFPPKVFYDKVGKYDVTLTITDAKGNTMTKTKSDYITIEDNIIAGKIKVVEACSGIFYDSGVIGNYKNQEDHTTTISPKFENSKVKVDFKKFKMEYAETCEYDYLEIYDGTDTTAQLIGKYCSYNSPGTIIANNASGSLTFKFVSDSQYPTKGWEAIVSCVAK
ncbi:CUB domain-containing protein [Aquimarina sp. 2201CG1-2-11]|uniref:CUB domain-containing protein n=1 Tax=Aquimarina discodermiae TaxID=3231043 RepID=UPI003463748E